MNYEYRILSASGSTLSKTYLDLGALEKQVNEAAQEGFRVCQMSTHAKPAAIIGENLPDSHTDLRGIVVIMERGIIPS